MRSLSAAGRVTVSGSARDMQSLQEKHKAYLQSLQNKNQAEKLLRDADDARRHEQLRREQGFNCCFSGANARTRKGSARRNSSCGSTPGVTVGNGFFGMRNGGGGYVGSKWEERTVEIRGESGEVYAIRPCGDRDDPRNLKSQDVICPQEQEHVEDRQPDVRENSEDAYALWAAAAATQIKSPCFNSPKSTSSAEAKAAKEKALALLRAKRQNSHSSIMGDTDSCDLNCSEEEKDEDEEAPSDLTQFDIPPVIESTPEEVESQIVNKAAEDMGGEKMQENDLLTCTHSKNATESMNAPSQKLPEPTVLAERIAKLPSKWLVSLLQVLEEAEADASLSLQREEHSRRHGADSQCNVVDDCQLAPISPSIGKASTTASDLGDCAPMPTS